MPVILTADVKINGSASGPWTGSTSQLPFFKAVSFGPVFGSGLSHFDIRNIKIGTSGYGSSDLFAPVLANTSEFTTVYGSGTAPTFPGGGVMSFNTSADIWPTKVLSTSLSEVWIQFELRDYADDGTPDYCDIYDSVANAAAKNMTTGIWSDVSVPSWNWDGAIPSNYGSGSVQDGTTWTTIDLHFSFPVVTPPSTLVWTAQTTPYDGDGYVQHVSWSPDLELFCAVGQKTSTRVVIGSFSSPPAHREAHSIMTSPDGITWTDRGQYFETGWRSVWSHGLGLFVAIGSCSSTGGSAPTIYTSPDGITWTNRTPSDVFNSNAVEWSEAQGQFVGIFSITVGTSAAQAVRYSTDGITWNDVTSFADITTFGAQTICYSPDLDLWIAGGNDGSDLRVISTSPDGQTWTKVSTPWDGSGNIYDIKWIPDLHMLIACGSDASFNIAVMTSLDGITWTNQTISGLAGTLDQYFATNVTSLGNAALIGIENIAGPGVETMLVTTDGSTYVPEGNPFDGARFDSAGGSWSNSLVAIPGHGTYPILISTAPYSIVTPPYPQFHHHIKLS